MFLSGVFIIVYFLPYVLQELNLEVCHLNALRRRIILKVLNRQYIIEIRLKIV